MQATELTREQIVGGIMQVLRERVGVTAELTPATSITRDLMLDSLRRLTLVVELESHFRLSFAEGEELGIDTIGDLARLIESRIAMEAGGDRPHPS